MANTINNKLTPFPVSKPVDTAAPATKPANTAAPAHQNLLQKIEDKFEGVLHKVEDALQLRGHHEHDDEEGAHIDNDGMVVPNHDGKTTSGNAGTVSANLSYYGGKILKNPEVTNMYLGDYFKTAAGQKDVTHNDAFMSDLVKNKDFTSVWHQYGVDSGTTQPSQILPGKIKSGQTVSQKQIESMLQKAVASGQIKPGTQSVYNFVLPPGAVLKMDDGTSSKQGLGGFHSSIHTPDGQTVYYAAEVYSKGSNGIDFTGGNGQDNLSITESHEISEAATDPDVGDAAATNDWTKLGWMDAQNGEIGDIEVNDAPPGTPLSSMFDRMDGYAVQKIWSNQDKTNEIEAKTPGPVEPLPSPTKPPA